MNAHTPKPWWAPRKIGPQTVEQLRKDYPNHSGLDDSDLLSAYGYEGHRYENPSLWDHLGDAVEGWEPLADSWIEMLEALEELLFEYECRTQDWGEESEKARAAIAKARGGKIPE